MSKEIIKKLLSPKLRVLLLILIGVFALGGIYLYYCEPLVFYSVIYTIQPPEDSPVILMNVPEWRSITDENQSSFKLIILNPTNTAIIIGECFGIEKVSETNERNPYADIFVGSFEKEDTTFIIDFDNIPKGHACLSGEVLLKPNQYKTYKFVIKNAQEGKYRIKMHRTTIDLVYGIQGFGVSNIFELYKKNK